MPKAAAHFGRALKYASGFGVNEGTKSASVSSVSASLADMDLGGGERREEKRQRSQEDDGEVAKEEYSKYMVFITIYTESDDVRNGGLKSALIRELERDLEVVLGLSDELEPGPPVRVRVERGTESVSVSVFKMDGSKIPSAVKRKLAGSGIGSGILPLIKQTAREFDTRDIVLEYPEVRSYRVDITLYADSTKHPLIKTKLSKLGIEFTWPLKTETGVSFYVNQHPGFVERAASSVGVLVCNFDGSELTRAEVAQFDDAKIGPHIVAGIERTIQRIYPEFNPGRIEITHEKEPVPTPVPEPRRRYGEYEVSVLIRAHPKQHPKIRQPTGLKGALTAHLNARDMYPEVITRVSSEGQGAVIDVSLPPGSQWTRKARKDFENAGIGNFTVEHIRSIDPSLYMPSPLVHFSQNDNEHAMAAEEKQATRAIS
jgi:hypothetical protein